MMNQYWSTMQPLNIVIMSKFFFKYYNFSQIFKQVNFYLHCNLGKEKFQVALETQPTISISFVNLVLLKTS